MGMLFYAKPDTPRRAFELGVLALSILTPQRPDLTIHLYGSRVPYLPFRHVDHGILRPEALNKIYNACFAGLSLSMTNVSLVPHEMLSAGCIPVVNDAPHNRIVLNLVLVRYASPTPHALAAALMEIADTKGFSILADRHPRAFRRCRGRRPAPSRKRAFGTALEDVNGTRWRAV